jgi:Ca2+-binding EF-hand superfamily protein
MGNQATGKRKLTRKISEKDAKSAFGKYNKQELGLLDKMFQDLAGRSPEDMKTISKETFLEVFGLPGILGERLFKAFDTKKTQNIDFDEFVSGLAGYVRGSTSDKMDMLFTLFDLDAQGYITRNELQSVLFSLITPAISFLPVDVEDEKRMDRRELITDGQGLSYKSRDVVEKINQMVKEAFDECDLDKSGGLDPQQFRKWCASHPEVLQGLESILIQNT